MNDSKHWMAIQALRRAIMKQYAIVYT